MNKINPLYILIFFVIVAFLMVYKSVQTQNKIVTIARHNVQIEQDGSYIKALKDRWKNPKMSQKRLENVLSKFPKEITSKEKKKGTYIIKAKTLNARSADKLMNALLNEAITFKKIKLEHTSKTTISMLLEVTL
jgi:predicted membrane-bound dolichyl-phosphate-mannose-protein mannosyltransferase